MGSGFSTITDVNAPNGGSSANFQESFLFAEVLKYSYLIQSDQDDEWHVNHNGRNGWVFNTEAHPMKVCGSITLIFLLMLTTDIVR
jgi:mannosyl-oligosaccharide alpha-1,2-mannosidase